MAIRTILTSIFILLCATIAGAENQPGTQAARKGAERWVQRVAAGKTAEAMGATRIPFLLAERDLRVKGGEPVRPGVWGITRFDETSLPAFLQKIARKLNGIKLESATRLTAKAAAGISPELGKVLPKGGYRVVFAPGPAKDALELFVDPEGKMVALIGAER